MKIKHFRLNFQNFAATFGLCPLEMSHNSQNYRWIQSKFRLFHAFEWRTLYGFTGFMGEFISGGRMKEKIRMTHFFLSLLSEHCMNS